ncbi:MAG: RNA polymerase sigma factor [Flavobacterium sp.]|nr:RNA polymerase sigma factor [Flavobacterium sp.]
MQHKMEAFRLLYEQHHRMVYHIAYQYLQNHEDAEEITQDVFVQVHQSMGKFEGKSSIKTWIYRISINKSLDFIKYKNSKKRWFIFGLNRVIVNDKQLLIDQDNDDDAIEQLDKSALLYTQINALPENQKTAFILSKQDNLSHNEISEIMNLSVSAIESLVFRAKKTLQQKLAEKFDEYYKTD